jgi:hypothetical protein
VSTHFERRSRLRVIVAIEPCLYRHAIGGALRELRPHLEVAVTSPEEMESEMERREYGLVICGRPGPTAGPASPAWIEYRPYDGKPAKACVGGRRSQIGEMHMTDILLMVDDIERRSYSAEPRGMRP